MARPLYQAISAALQARVNCVASGNTDWFDRNTERVLRLVRNHMPSGAGIDCGTRINFDKSKPEQLVFDFSFHHMNESGCYDGWTEHQLYVTPSLLGGPYLRITGRDRNQIKDYLHETYQHALTALVDEYEGEE